MKPWYQSKTIWISILSCALYVLTGQGDLNSLPIHIPPDWLLIIGLGAQAINRFWTDKPLV